MIRIRKGAEADLYLTEFSALYFPWNSEKVLIKKRISKGYRQPELDHELRQRRTIHEAKLLHEAKAYVHTPVLYEIDTEDCTITMEYVEGARAKDDMTEDMAEEIGACIARLHEGGIVHGDLTTSNIILKGSRIYFIDFGLGEVTTEIEPQAVDLHLLKQALESTHYTHWRKLWKKILEGYKTRSGSHDVIKRIREIEKRGRYSKR
ncbi:MAG: Kae1-associated serine/threonine protein kinase [Theionarchaea archaeon]|nr:Kae1-associated serine/threonine protein kinase [Theionarchaea archaeon]MBU7037768.1 Kae1-associated serine/threonine protein kinase [Theionarchaea archaeon]